MVSQSSCFLRKFHILTSAMDCSVCRLILAIMEIEGAIAPVDEVRTHAY